MARFTAGEAPADPLADSLDFLSHRRTNCRVGRPEWLHPPPTDVPPALT